LGALSGGIPCLPLGPGLELISNWSRVISLIGLQFVAISQSNKIISSATFYLQHGLAKGMIVIYCSETKENAALNHVNFLSVSRLCMLTDWPLC
jgi:hypothetical protein